MFSCVGDQLRWTAGALEVVVTIEHDESPDTSYLDYEWHAERKAAYMRHEFGYCGIVAEAMIYDEYDNAIIVGSCSVWGIESDSGEEYLEETAREMATEAINEAGQYMPALARLLAEHEGELATLTSLVTVA